MKDFIEVLLKFIIPWAVVYFVVINTDPIISEFVKNLTKDQALNFVIWLFIAGPIYAGAFYACRFIFYRLGWINEI